MPFCHHVIVDSQKVQLKTASSFLWFISAWGPQALPFLRSSQWGAFLVVQVLELIESWPTSLWIDPTPSGFPTKVAQWKFEKIPGITKVELLFSLAMKHWVLELRDLESSNSSHWTCCDVFFPVAIDRLISYFASSQNLCHGGLIHPNRSAAVPVGMSWCLSRQTTPWRGDAAQAILSPQGVTNTTHCLEWLIFIERKNHRFFFQTFPNCHPKGASGWNMNISMGLSKGASKKKEILILGTWDDDRKEKCFSFGALEFTCDQSRQSARWHGWKTHNSPKNWISSQQNRNIYNIQTTSWSCQFIPASDRLW